MNARSAMIRSTSVDSKRLVRLVITGAFIIQKTEISFFAIFPINMPTAASFALKSLSESELSQRSSEKKMPGIMQTPLHKALLIKRLPEITEMPDRRARG